MRIAAGVLIALALLLSIDAVANWGKIYPGVKIGSVDVSGMTAEQVQSALDDAYGPLIASGSVTVYANEDAAAAAKTDEQLAEERATAEQLSVETGRASRDRWTTDAADLDAHVAGAELSRRALEVGREDGGALARLGALLFGRSFDVELTFGDGLEALASDIDQTIGTSRVDWGVAVTSGRAQVTEGHDGNLVDRDELASELSDALLGDDRGFVASARFAPVRVDGDEAQRVCDSINAAIAYGAVFTCEDASFTAYSADLGDWVRTDVVEADGSFSLEPSIDESAAKTAILAGLSFASGEAPHVTFDTSSEDVVVKTDGQACAPDAAAAARALDDALFADGASAPDAAVAIEAPLVALPAELTFDEALDAGVIGRISRYTTEYLDGSGTENRRHNIHLVADFLNDSVARANGGTWSFNDVAGQCNSERGFLGAGAIVDNTYQDAVGGGICQVATTVFNAVYEAGYPVERRSNHSLYIASYPKGRDAAVSWPDLDLVWKNDAASDVLLRTSYTDTSITVTLYGVDPGYKVSTRTGEWSAGAAHSTRIERDSTLASGTSYVKTIGVDGAKIDVVRTVKDASGAVLHEDVFHSEYDPVTEVIAAAPDADVSANAAQTG